MYHVYRIRSRSHPEETFVGMSRNVKKRLALHNQGDVGATRNHRPWKLVFYAAFSRKSRARLFYEFLKSPAGEEFGRTRLWPKTPDKDSP